MNNYTIMRFAQRTSFLNELTFFFFLFTEDRLEHYMTAMCDVTAILVLKKRI